MEGDYFPIPAPESVRSVGCTQAQIPMEFSFEELEQALLRGRDARRVVRHENDTGRQEMKEETKRRLEEARAEKVSRHEEMVTAEEIATILGIGRGAVKRRAVRLGVKGLSVLRDGKWTCMFTAEEAETVVREG